ncbi:MAG TPA: DoxX-like family protein [Opitutaceae bacterium]|nr:DoxX-like family protein [Opitutaceae bacterium]
MPPLPLIRLAVALVWLYEGFWCKVLGRAPHQEGIVKAVPSLGGAGGGKFLVLLGYAETALGAWILAGWQPTAAALVQTVTLVAMNAVGLTYARQLIHDPPGMVLKNFALLVLAWVAAAPRP